MPHNTYIQEFDAVLAIEGLSWGNGLKWNGLKMLLEEKKKINIKKISSMTFTIFTRRLLKTRNTRVRTKSVTSYGNSWMYAM